MHLMIADSRSTRIRCALAFLGAAFLFTASMACGGDQGSEPPGPYTSICQVQKDCLDDQFVRTYGTVNGCATALRANADVSTKTGACLEATEANFECRAANVQCRNNQISYGGQCATELEAQTLACRPDVLGPEQYENACEALKQCLGQTEFENDYTSLEGCVAEFQNELEQQGQTCQQLLSEAIYCNLDNFVCDQGAAPVPPECQDEYDAHSMQCSN